MALVWPAFSADAPSSTTTRARIIGPGALPAPARVQPTPGPSPDDDIDPATGLSRSTVVRPLREVPPPPAAGVPGLQPLAPAPGSIAHAHIALILPITSPMLGKLALAVRDGFAAAATVAGPDAPSVDVMEVADEGRSLLEACARAQAAGAILVVGGLTRDGASVLARSDCPRQPVLALNEPQGIVPADLPPNLYTVSLAVEQEARQVALMAVADGRRSAIVIASPSPLARRARDAFEREWSRAAGEIHEVEFSGEAGDAPLLRERLAGVKGDMVFLALEAADTRVVRPYVPGALPVYATSISVNPRAETMVNVDLQGLRYVEMPWFVQPDHPAVMVYPRPERAMSVDEERLYAFGIDALRLSVHLLRGEARRVPLDGVTGRISLESGNAFVRTLTPAEVDGGRVIPLRTP